MTSVINESNSEKALKTVVENTKKAVEGKGVKEGGLSAERCPQ